MRKARTLREIYFFPRYKPASLLSCRAMYHFYHTDRCNDVSMNDVVTWKTKLLSSYSASMNPNKGRLILKPLPPSSMKRGHTFPPQEQPSLQSPLLPHPAPPPPPILLRPSTVVSYSFTISQLGLRVTFLLTGSYCYLHCYCPLRFWKGHINCPHVPTIRHNNLVRMLSQPWPTQVLPPNMLYRCSSHLH